MRKSASEGSIQSDTSFKKEMSSFDLTPGNDETSSKDIDVISDAVSMSSY